jgi:hypothetical protein
MNRMLSAALAAATMASTGSAHAMTYSYTNDDKIAFVTAKGVIQYDEKAIFQTFMGSLPKDVQASPSPSCSTRRAATSMALTTSLSLSVSTRV